MAYTPKYFVSEEFMRRLEEDLRERWPSFGWTYKPGRRYFRSEKYNIKVRIKRLHDSETEYEMFVYHGGITRINPLAKEEFEVQTYYDRRFDACVINMVHICIKRAFRRLQEFTLPLVSSIEDYHRDRSNQDLA